MASIEEKLSLLSKLAAKFQEQNLSWAIGSSLLLYLKGYVDTFNDLDIMVTAEDAGKMESILHTFGTLQPSEPGTYATKHFREFLIGDIEVDMIGGFAIVKDGNVYDCDLHPSQITGYAEVLGQQIPLQSIALWRTYYDMIGRKNKVDIIDSRQISV